MKTGKVGKVAAGSKRKAGSGSSAKRAGKAGSRGGQPQRPVKKQKKVQVLLRVLICVQPPPITQLAGQADLQRSRSLAVIPSSHKPRPECGNSRSLCWHIPCRA